MVVNLSRRFESFMASWMRDMAVTKLCLRRWLTDEGSRDFDKGGYDYLDS